MPHTEFLIRIGGLKGAVRTGATLVLASHNVAALEKVANEEGALGRTMHARALDQAEESSIFRLRDSVLAEFGRLVGLIKNAVAHPMKSADAPLAAELESN